MANSASFPILGGGGFGAVTQTQGTKINRVLPARKGAFTRLQKLVYTAGGTAHTLTVMRSLGRTTTSAAAAAGQAVILITANPGPTGNALATNDYVAYRTADGQVVFDTVTVSGLTVTLGSNLVLALPAGADVWMFGVAADTDPNLNATAHQTLRGVVSATSTYFEDLVGLFASHFPDEPILIQSDNATNAGVLEQVSYAYSLYGR